MQLLRRRTWPGWLLLILSACYNIVSALSNLQFVASFGGSTLRGWINFFLSPPGQLGIMILGLCWIGAGATTKETLTNLLGGQLVPLAPTERRLGLSDAGGLHEDAAGKLFGMLAPFRCDRAPLKESLGTVRIQLMFTHSHSSAIHVNPAPWLRTDRTHVTFRRGDIHYAIIGIWSLVDSEYCDFEAIEHDRDSATSLQRYYVGLTEHSNWTVRLRLMTASGVTVLEQDYQLQFRFVPKFNLVNE